MKRENRATNRDSFLSNILYKTSYILIFLAISICSTVMAQSSGKLTKEQKKMNDEIDNIIAENTWKDIKNDDELRKLFVNESHFKDPISIQLNKVRYRKNDRRTEWCGEVNAKNSYGAYVGFRRFHAYVIFETKNSNLTIANNQDLARLVDIICSKALEK